jgi:hypothetical protein
VRFEFDPRLRLIQAAISSGFGLANARIMILSSVALGKRIHPILSLVLRPRARINEEVRWTIEITRLGRAPIDTIKEEELDPFCAL